MTTRNGRGPDSLGLQRRAVGALSAVTVLAVMWTAPAGAQEGNWPGWRGDGSGVSQERGLPVEWHQLGYRWRTPVEGTGSSSPIVWEDQVFLTTSVERPVIQAVDRALRWAAVAGALVVIGCLVVPLRRRPRRPRDGISRQGPAWFRWLVGAERAAVVALTGYFFWKVADLLLRRHLEFTPEQPDIAWILAGEVAVLGLLAAVGSLGIRSPWRLVGVLLVGACGAVFYVWQPPTVSTMPVPIDRQMGVLRPLVAGLGWLFVVSVVVQMITRRWGGRVLEGQDIVRSLATALVAGLAFGYYNVVEPQLGVMREVWALDRNTGEVEWRTGVAAPAGRKYVYNTYATPTAVTNGKMVVADFGPIMVAVSTDGEIAWTREEPLYAQYLRYGSVRSPVIYGSMVVYLYVPENPDIEEGELTGEAAYLAALSLETGEEVWRVTGIEGGHDSYGSPLLVPTGNGGMSVVVSVFDHAHAYDAATGEHLWSFDAPLAHPVPSPVADGRRVYVSGGLYGPQLVAAIELGSFAAGAGTVPKGRSVPARLDAMWTTNRQTPDIGSPVVYGGLAYWVTSDGRMFCYDVESGEMVWRRRLSGSFEPSLVAGDGKVYVQAADGRTIVLSAGREFVQLAENHLYEFEGSHASMAIADGSLFIRGRNALVAVGSGGTD